jgi:Tol biopolymer transport system component
MAVGFDPHRLEVAGDEVPVLGDVMQALFSGNSSTDTGAAQISFSATGLLAYATGGVSPESSPHRTRWISRDGKLDPFPLPASVRSTEHPRISPDGTRVAFDHRPSRDGTRNLAVLDLATMSTTWLDLEGHQTSPVWSPDSRRLAFSSSHAGGAHNLYRISADLNVENLHRITESDSGQMTSDWSVNNQIAFVQDHDIWVVDVEGGTPEPFVADPDLKIHEWYPTFSPDGQWLA